MLSKRARRRDVCGPFCTPHPPRGGSDARRTPPSGGSAHTVHPPVARARIPRSARPAYSSIPRSATCGGGRPGRCSSTHSSTVRHHSKSQSMRSSRPVGISSCGIRHQPICSRLSIGNECQTSRTVTTWSRPVWATSSTSVPRRGVQGRQHAPGARGEHVGHRLGPVGHPGHAQAAQPADRARTPLRGEVAALGEDHERVVLVEVAGQVAHLGLEVVARGGMAGDEPARQPRQQHPERGVPGEGLLEHDPWLAAVPVHQGVHQRERVTGPRVPAEDQQRLARERVRARADGLDLQPQHPARLPEEHDQVGLHDVVVDPLEERPPQEQPEPRGDPEPEQLHQREALQRQVHHQQPQQPDRPQPAGHERRDDVPAEQPQRQRRPHQHRERDHERRDHDPLQRDGEPARHQPGPTRCSAR